MLPGHRPPALWVPLPPSLAALAAARLLPLHWLPAQRTQSYATASNRSLGTGGWGQGKGSRGAGELCRSARRRWFTTQRLACPQRFAQAAPWHHLQ